MGGSLSFGSSARHIFGLFTLAFTMASAFTALTKRRTANSLARSTKSTPSPINWLRLFISIKFQVLFHPPSGVLFTFPSRYLFTIDLQTFLALEGGPPRFGPDFTCPTLLRNILEFYTIFTYGTITLYGYTFQRHLVNRSKIHIEVLQPHSS